MTHMDACAWVRVSRKMQYISTSTLKHGTHALLSVYMCEHTRSVTRSTHVCDMVQSLSDGTEQSKIKPANYLLYAQNGDGHVLVLVQQKRWLHATRSRSCEVTSSWEEVCTSVDSNILCVVCAYLVQARLGICCRAICTEYVHIRTYAHSTLLCMCQYQTQGYLIIALKLSHSMSHFARFVAWDTVTHRSSHTRTGTGPVVYIPDST